LDLTTANGKLTAHVMAAYAQWKSEIVGERMREYQVAREDGLMDDTDGKRAPKLNNTLASTASNRVISSMVRPEKKEEEPLPAGKVYGYVRVSTDRQSVESQLGPVYRYMERLYSDMASPGGMIRDEGVSALKVQFSKRPEASQLLKKLKRGDHIVFLRPARAFRSVKDMIEVVDYLHDSGIIVHLAEGGMKSGDMSFRLSMQIMVLMAQIESEENRRRVRDTLAWMWDSGLVPKADRHLPKWIHSKILNNEKGEPERHIVPDLDYLEDCRLVNEHMKVEPSRVKVFERMEAICAHREHRLPMSKSGWDPLLAMKRNSDLLEHPNSLYTRKGQEGFRDRCREARAKKKLVNPTYRYLFMIHMSRHWDDYQSYLKLVEEEDRETAIVTAVRPVRPQLAKV
jgi:DNA invertase Pin-like site-specific DNA recombinase